MTPFPFYASVVQKHESGVAAYYGLQRCLVGVGKLVFGSCTVFPSAYSLFRACCETQESVAMLLSVIVESVYLVEVNVVCLLEVW